MPSVLAASRALARSREAIAVTAVQLALLHGGNDFFQADVGGAEYAETKLC